MSKPTKENIALVMNGFEEFYKNNVKDQEIDIKAFFDFIEPKFIEAGYREKFNPTLKNNTGRGMYLS